MSATRLVTLSPDNKPLHMRVYVRQIDDSWAAMVVGNDLLAPRPGERKGAGFLAATPKEAEREALEYYSQSELAN